SEETSDLDTTGIGTIDPNLMWQAIQGLEKKSDLWAGTLNKRITDASLKLKIPETAEREEKQDGDSRYNLLKEIEEE
ncbi:unnamed protein product, partial [Porites lobata]